MTGSLAVLLAVVVLQPLAEADHIIQREPDRAIELDRRGVASSNLQVDFWASRGAQQALGLVHQGPAETATPVRRIDTEVIDPPAVPVVPGHDRPDDRTIINGDQKEIRTDLELAADVLARVVPRSGQPAPLPEAHDGDLVRRVERADLHAHLPRRGQSPGPSRPPKPPPGNAGSVAGAVR